MTLFQRLCILRCLSCVSFVINSVASAADVIFFAAFFNSAVCSFKSLISFEWCEVLFTVNLMELGREWLWHISRALLILYYKNLEEVMLSTSRSRKLSFLHEVLCVRPCQPLPFNHSELTALTLNRSANNYFGSTRWHFRLEHVGCMDWMCPLLEIWSSRYHTNASTDCQHVSTIRSRTSARCG